jgi:hypothetical protein
MRRAVLVLLVLVIAAGLLCWPVADETWVTAMGWSGGPDPNWHTRTIAVGLPCRWLTLEHNWNLRQGTNERTHRVEVSRLLADLAVVLGVPLAAWLAFRFWRGKARRRKGACLRCGYDLTGNVSGVCPECGTSIGAKA